MKALLQMNREFMPNSRQSKLTRNKKKKRKNFVICNEKCWLTDRVSPCFEKRYRTTHWHTIKFENKSINCYRYPQGLFFHLNIFNCMNLSFCFFLLLKTFLLTSYFLSECANGHKFALSRNKFFSFFCWNFCQVKKMKNNFNLCLQI